jgi:hypothetical protein
MVLASALALTYLTLRTSARRVRGAPGAQRAPAGHGDGHHRPRRAPALLAVAGDSAVVAAARAAPPPGRAAALARLVAPSDSGMPTELWTADGRRLAFVGRDLRSDVAARPADEAGVAVPRQGLAHLSPEDSLGLGWLYADGERVHFWS